MVETIIKHVIYTNKRSVPVHAIVLFNLWISPVSLPRMYNRKDTENHNLTADKSSQVLFPSTIRFWGYVTFY